MVRLFSYPGVVLCLDERFGYFWLQTRIRGLAVKNLAVRNCGGQNREQLRKNKENIVFYWFVLCFSDIFFGVFMIFDIFYDFSKKKKRKSIKKSKTIKTEKTFWYTKDPQNKTHKKENKTKNEVWLSRIWQLDKVWVPRIWWTHDGKYCFHVAQNVW